MHARAVEKLHLLNAEQQAGNAWIPQQTLHHCQHLQATPGVTHAQLVRSKVMLIDFTKSSWRHYGLEGGVSHSISMTV